MFSFV